MERMPVVVEIVSSEGDVACRERERPTGSLGITAVLTSSVHLELLFALV